MDDNLRYISLQYIKGNNYDNITCFNFDKIRTLLEDISESYKDKADTIELNRRLKNVKQDDICNIGEILIDDLVNYYEFKKYKDDIFTKREDVETKIRDTLNIISLQKTDLKNKSSKSKINRDKILELLKDIDTNRKTLIQNSDVSVIDEATLKESYEKFQKALKNTKTELKYDYDGEYKNKKDKMERLKINIITEYNKIDDKADDEADDKADDDADDKSEKYDKIINNISRLLTDDETRLILKRLLELNNNNNVAAKKIKLMEFYIYANTEIDYIIVYYDLLINLKETYDYIENFKDDELKGTTSQIKKYVERVKDNKELTTITKKLSQSNDNIKTKESEYLSKIEENDKYILELNKLINILNEHSKICEANIKKYKQIFQHNDISSIDDAFMIKSYSDFLKKLKKLKENLQSKDKGKIKRSLINTIEKLIHLYGLNINNKATFEAENLKFLANRIVNYL